MSLKLRLTITVLLYFFTLILCLGGILSDEPHVDEALWLKRSMGVLQRLETNPEQATTHLGHPGVAPALVMASAQVLIPRLVLGDGELARKLKSSFFSARLGCALVGCLTVALVFFGFSNLLGAFPALLAALLLALDLRFIGFARIIHLDATLTFLSLACLLLFLHAELRSSLKLKIGAGILWGLCIATKPTAAVLILVFLVFKILRALANKDLRHLWIRWSDFWAVIIAHLTFALIYTRLWFHLSEYRERLKIRIPLAGKIYGAGSYLQENILLSSLILIGLLVISYFTWRHYRNRFSFANSPVNLALIISVFFSSLLFFPQVLENIIRYWKWATGLSSEAHVAFGQQVAAPAGGYWLELFTVLNEYLIFGLLVGCAVIIYKFIAAYGQQVLVPATLLFMILIWLAVLNVSDKQSWRYALPILPAICLVSAYGLTELLHYIRKLLAAKLSITMNHKYSALVLILLLLVFSLPNYFSWSSMQREFFNSTSGSIAAASTRGQKYNFVGQVEAISYLLNLCDKSKTKIKVAFFGSSNNLDLIKKYFLTEHSFKCLELGYFKPEQANYAWHFASHPHLVSDYWQDVIKNSSVVFSYDFQEHKLLEIIELPQAHTSLGN